MKLIILLGMFFTLAYSQLPCDIIPLDADTTKSAKWQTMPIKCTQQLSFQINKEVNAAITYLAMGAYFLRSEVNRPGLSKFFFDAASEEREHAMHMMEYLLVRGVNNINFNKLIKVDGNVKLEWVNGAAAFEDALVLEASVTESIRNVIRVCDENTRFGPKDYSVVDFLTGQFLPEQYRGQRDLAGKLSTLRKMQKAEGVLGEFLFDKMLLS